MTQTDALKKARGLFGPEAWAGHLESSLMAVGFWEPTTPGHPGVLRIRGSGRGWTQAFKDAALRKSQPDLQRPKELLLLAEINAPGRPDAGHQGTESATR